MIFCLRFKDTNTHFSIQTAKQQQLLFKVLILMRYESLKASENQDTYSGVMVIRQNRQNWLPKFRNRNQYLSISFSSSFFFRGIYYLQLLLILFLCIYRSLWFFCFVFSRNYWSLTVIDFWISNFCDIFKDQISQEPSFLIRHV